MTTMTDARAVEVLAAMREDGGVVADADYTAAIDRAVARLREPVGVGGDREADRRRFTDAAFNDWLDTGISDAGHTVRDAVGDVQAAWAGWEARQFAGDAVLIAECCGREECGGECGNEWRGMGMYRKPEAAPQPPAEAQAQGGGEVVQEHYEHFLAYSGLSDNVWLRYAYFHGADIGLDRPERPAKVLRFDKRDFDHSIEVYEDGYYVSHDDYLAALYTAPPSAPVGVEAAEAMGARGGPASESERLAFEAWMRGHCWPLCATWDGTGYRSDAEQGGRHCPDAARTRGLWAAWRDRAALAQQPAAVDGAAREYLAARDAYDAATRPPNSHAPAPRLKHGDPIVLRLRAAHVALDTALATQHQEPTTCKHDFRRDEDNGGECCQLCGEVRRDT